MAGSNRLRSATGAAATALVATFAFLSVPTTAYPAANVCANTKERMALDTRVLQTELMVAALSCGQRDEYNAFVNTYSDELKQQGAALQQYFNRVYGGKQASTTLNAFVTKLANDSSWHSQQIKYGYCYFTWELFNEASATPPHNLRKLTEKAWIPERHGVRACDGVASTKKPS